MKLNNSNDKREKHGSVTFYNITITSSINAQYLTFAWSHKCLAEVRSTSYTNLCLIPHRELRQSFGAFRDASIKTIFSPSTIML